MRRLAVVIEKPGLLNTEDHELMALLKERPIYAVAREYGQNPRTVRNEWSDYDLQRAYGFLSAENGNAGEAERAEIVETVQARLGGDMSNAILEHLPTYWTARTREQVTNEGYNADYVAEELGKINLSLAGEAVVRPQAEINQVGSIPFNGTDSFVTGPLDAEE